MDSVVVFLAYLEAPNSILVTNPTNYRFSSNFPDLPTFSLFPHVGPMAVWEPSDMLCWVSLVFIMHHARVASFSNHHQVTHGG